jgi:hypothetical protein
MREGLARALLRLVEITATPGDRRAGTAAVRGTNPSLVFGCRALIYHGRDPR